MSSLRFDAKLFWLGVALLAAPLVLAACGDDGSPTSPGGSGEEPIASPSFTTDIQPILANTASCASASCHGGSPPTGGLDLLAVTRDELVGRSANQGSNTLVIAGDADNSYLIWKLDGDSRISGGRMPLNRTPLSTARIQTIRNWIDQGALDN